jgi:BirA family transcriptional regulator, biotin operon repressor / biotin---[acetyl-CoA-carboxylase] ligase
MARFRHIGRRRIHLESTDSTNFRAAELARDPANAGTVVTADHQVRGRGQYGRTWESPPRINVLLSALVFPPVDLRQPAVLTAFAAVAVAETILCATGRQSSIKWPNDVLLDGKKVCGILIECGTVGARPGADEMIEPHAIIGIGLNVNQSADDFASSGLPDATSLSIAAGQRLGLEEITELLIGNLDTEYGQLLDGELANLEGRWAARVGLLDRPVAAELTDGTEVRGRLAAMSLRGLSLLQGEGKSRHLQPEEVRHLRSTSDRQGQ